MPKVCLPPKEEDETPNDGIDEAPTAGIELPKAGDEDEAPETGVEAGAPNTPVDVPPKIELLAREPNGDVQPDVIASN